MKILMISVRADIGGGPKHMLDLASYLKKNKNISLSIAAPDEEPFAKKFREVSDYFIEIPKRSFTPWSYFKLLLHCKKHNISLVHSHGRGAGVYGRLLTLFGIQCIHTFHGIHMEKTVAGKLKYFLDYLLHPLTNKYICVSHDEKNKFEQINFSNQVPISIIENGIDQEHLKREFDRLRQKSPQFTLGTLARLHFQKGIDLLIEMAYQHKDFLNKHRIIIKVAGSGPDHESLSELIEKKDIGNLVQLCGQTLNPIAFLAQLNCYISFARWEGLPLSVLEAKACQLPTLLSNVTGHDNFETRFHNSDEFISILENWIKNPPKPEPLPKTFTLETMAERTYNLYEL
jgi:glycosyltransferase involved in cell wall biosynthesis